MTRPETPLHDVSFETGSCGVGFVTHLRGEKSRAIVKDALTVLGRLSHRGAVGTDPDSGDGAGILLQLPHRFFKREGLRLGFEMPRRRGYGVGQVFLPKDPTLRAACERIVAAVIAEEGQRLIGWRDVPVDESAVGPIAARAMPVMRQVYIGRRRLVPTAFERQLYVIRKRIEDRVRQDNVGGGVFHFASCSAETIVYKGLCLPTRLRRFYADLQDDDVVSAIAIVHSRFATNTRPTWDLAQPLRAIAHNGEINTVRGNRAWIAARRRLISSAKFKGGVEWLWPIIDDTNSDSMSFDNMLELLVLGGLSLPHAMMMMIPEAWEHDQAMPDDRRAFYEYAGSLLEPWDGPAAVLFTDGFTVGATLDRNGLRPARYVVTHDERVVLSSEAGVLALPPESIKRRGRLQPGRMFLVDTVEGRILEDDVVKREISQRFPYRRWLDQNTIHFDDLPALPAPTPINHDELVTMQKAAGWVDDDVNAVIAPMVNLGKEPVGSMGNDTPLAVLSTKAPPLFDHFHQRFAQVTNPPIDPLRERLVMTIATSVGPDGNTLEESPEQCHHLNLPGPVLTSAELERLKAVRDDSLFSSRTISTLYAADSDGHDPLGAALARVCAAAVDAVDDGDTIIILSDRGRDHQSLAIPSLLAVSAVQQRLVHEGIRTHVGLIVEAADARSVHHVACLLGFGAAAVNPWLAVDTVKAMVKDAAASADDAAAGAVDEDVERTAVDRFTDAIDDGILKVMSKLGISTLQSYRGAQLFEIVGLDKDVVDRFFTGTPARISGLSLAGIHEDLLRHHRAAYGSLLPMMATTPPTSTTSSSLPTGGLFVFKREGERHLWDPFVVKALQKAARADDDDPALWEAFRVLADGDGADIAPAPTTLRDLLTFTRSKKPIALDDVEPASAIVKRFVSGAMSLGALSPEAHETLAIAMNRLGARSNSGEGGEEAHRDVVSVDDNGEVNDRRSFIRQVASGRFGVTLSYLTGARELQIKMAQGAKPGEGGQLPGDKVNARIAAVRHSTPGVTLISPPPHHDIYSIEDLKQLIFDLQSLNPAATISVKLVAQAGIGVVAAGVVKAGAGGITISGFEGGTGASPLSSLKHAGVPWELGISEARQVLSAVGLRDRVRLQVDGGLRTGRDVVMAALLGADEMGLATSALVAGGCVMMRKCHLNTCGVGVATQDEKLRGRYAGKPEHIMRYLLWVAEDVRRVMASLGVARFDDLVGNTALLEPRRDLEGRHRHVDVTSLLVSPPPVPGPATPPRVDMADHFDVRFTEAVSDIAAGRPFDADGSTDGAGHVAVTVENVHRAVGSHLSGAVARARAEAGIIVDDDAAPTAIIRLQGSAGQSFGAFCARGISLRLEGEANDGVAKGLCGGEIVVRRPPSSGAPDDVLVGNVALYGATSGDLYVGGRAGERFAVRNSGAHAVVEGVGDHGCEYMTGGSVVVLGPIGRNFGAGMSGGVVYVLEDPHGPSVLSLTHPSLLVLSITDDDAALLQRRLAQHVTLTGSRVALQLEREWTLAKGRFKKVVSPEYLAALARTSTSMPT